MSVAVTRQTTHPVVIGGAVGGVILVFVLLLLLFLIFCYCCVCKKGPPKSYPVTPPTAVPQPKRPKKNAIYEELPCGPIIGTEPQLMRQIGIEHDPTLIKHDNASYHGSDEPLCGSSDVSGLSGVSGNIPGAHKMPFYNDESDRFLVPPQPWKTVSNSTFNTTATHSTVLSGSDTEDHSDPLRLWNSEVHYPHDAPQQNRRYNSQCAVNSTYVDRNRSASFSNGLPQPQCQCRSCRRLPFNNAPFASNSTHKHTISSASSGTNSISSPYHQRTNSSPYHLGNNTSSYHQVNGFSPDHVDSPDHCRNSASPEHRRSSVSTCHEKDNPYHETAELSHTSQEPHQTINPDLVNYLLDHVQHSRNCQLPGCCCRSLKQSLSNLADSEGCKSLDYFNRKTASTVTSSSTESESDTPDHKTRKRSMHLQLSKEPDEDLYPHNHISTRSYKIRSNHKHASSEKRRSRSLADLTPITEIRETPTPAVGGPIVPGTPVYPPKSLGEDGHLNDPCVLPTIQNQHRTVNSYLQPRPQILKQKSISTDNIPVLCLNDCVAKLTTPSPTKHSIYLTSSNVQTSGMTNLKTVPETTNSESDGSNTSSRSRSPPEAEPMKSSQSDNEDTQYSNHKSSFGRYESTGYESGDASSLKRLGSFSQVESSGYESGGSFSVFKSGQTKNLDTLLNQTAESKLERQRKVSVNSQSNTSRQDNMPSKTSQSSRSSSPFETETKRGDDGAVIQTTEC